MSKITFIPDGLSVEVADGTTVLQAARLAGVALESPCDAMGTCGKCKVKIAPDRLAYVVQKGSHQLAENESRQGYILACQTEIKGDLVVEMPTGPQNTTLQIVNAGICRTFELEQTIVKKYVAVQRQTSIYAVERLIGVEKGNTEGMNYGVVVDIGTTTLVAALLDLNSGRELGAVSALNPQATLAQDVLSRIKIASEEAGLTQLSLMIIDEINRMIVVLAEEAGIRRQSIYEVVLSGNTCMLHLAINRSPASLGKYPYTPVVTGGCQLRSADYNLDISEFGLIYLPPIISAYVGADITSGILASQLDQQSGLTLLVDIGTNGEIVLAANGNLAATSTAAGPAFEGMNIAFGMRAAVGAIEGFEITDTGQIELRVIGNGVATGICGSGLLDIVGELVAHGIVDQNGRLKRADSSELSVTIKERLVAVDGKPTFRISEKVWLTQKDIRQVQLAKGAIRAGIETLLHVQQVTADQIDRVLIAGSFGYHLQTKSLINIGLLPPQFAGKVQMIGNTSKTGGQVFLLNQTFRRQMAEKVRDIEVVELANCADFDRLFVRCLEF